MAAAAGAMLGGAALGAGASIAGNLIGGEYGQSYKELEGMNQMANTLGTQIGNYANNAAMMALQGYLGATANQASAAAQSAQGQFNQASADNANRLNNATLANQYGFNSAMMNDANAYNSMMWERAANWNEAMWEKQAKFNAEQAQIQRDWSERMENTRYQRAIGDMEKAGLNPILAVTGGGLATGAGSAPAASVGGAQMSSASANMAQGGILGANAATEGLYQGQMEFTGGVMKLLASAIDGMASAQQAMGPLGEWGQQFLESLSNIYGKNPEEELKNTGYQDHMHYPEKKSKEQIIKEHRDAWAEEDSWYR